VEAYDGPQIVGMDLHRRRSVPVWMAGSRPVQIAISRGRTRSDGRRTWQGRAHRPPYPCRDGGRIRRLI
jgi:hypothetical protein